MNYSEPLVNQLTVFLKALGCGIILGVIYDLMSFCRMIAGERKFVYITFDLIFSVTAAIISFFFMVIYNSGQVRFNLMLSEFAGAVAFHFALGKYFLSISQKYINKIKRAIIFLFSPFVKIYRKAMSFFAKKFVRGSERASEEKNIEKKIKKFINIRKIHLKNKNKSV